MGTHPIFESDFDCLTECVRNIQRRRKCFTERTRRKSTPGTRESWRFRRQCRNAPSKCSTYPRTSQVRSSTSDADPDCRANAFPRPDTNGSGWTFPKPCWTSPSTNEKLRATCRWVIWAKVCHFAPECLTDAFRYRPSNGCATLIRRVTCHQSDSMHFSKPFTLRSNTALGQYCSFIRKHRTRWN